MSHGISLELKAACIAAIFLAGCGGGGSGGGGGFTGSAPPPSEQLQAPTAQQAAAQVALTGKATYDSVPNTQGGLVYADTAQKPVRGAYVEVLDESSNALANTVTDDTGAYSVSVPSGTRVSVRVRAQLTRTGGAGATWNVTVRDNTSSDAIYSIQSPVFSTGSAALTRDLRAESGWGVSSYTGQRAAGPFAVLDTVYSAIQKVVSAAPATSFPALKVFWSVNNAPTSGDVTLGQIGTSYFDGTNIYVLGKEDVDTDEYDSPVIAHEWGHYYQASFTRDDSPGGSHSQADRTDRRLAFSEGWGNGWSGIALGRRNYVDSSGDQQADGFGMDLSTGPTQRAGWFREWSIQSIFWNLNQQVGFAPIHNAMINASFKGGVPVTAIHPFATTFNAVNPTHAATLNALLTAQGITAGADPFGPDEQNNGGVARALPLYASATVGATTQVCVSNAAGTYNKLGNTAYLRFTAPTARSYQFTVTATTTGATPRYDIYRGGKLARAGNKINLQAGEHVVAVSDSKNTSACFDVAIQ